MRRLLTVTSTMMLILMSVMMVPEGTHASSVPERVSNQASAPALLISQSLVQPLRIVANSGDEGASIANSIAATNAIVGFTDELFPLAPGVIAAFSPSSPAGVPVIIISEDYRGADPRTLGVILIHEGTHLRDLSILGKDGDPPYSCLGREFDAFGAMVRYWNAEFPGGKPNPLNDVEVQANELALALNPQLASRQVLNILAAYAFPGEECSVP